MQGSVAAPSTDAAHGRRGLSRGCSGLAAVIGGPPFSPRECSFSDIKGFDVVMVLG